ncbi:Hypothetical predicted protein, partial [Olea europaea subsp. europaea]
AFRQLVIQGPASIKGLVARKLPGLSSVLHNLEVKKLEKRLPLPTIQDLKEFNQELQDSDQALNRL